MNTKRIAGTGLLVMTAAFLTSCQQPGTEADSNAALWRSAKPNSESVQLKSRELESALVEVFEAISVVAEDAEQLAAYLTLDSKHVGDLEAQLKDMDALLQAIESLPADERDTLCQTWQEELNGFEELVEKVLNSSGLSGDVFGPVLSELLDRVELLEKEAV